jgi:aspartyl-tRNA(Asn)/glutamyl-tRNA(Gln) amidotransferase subunit A
MVRRCIAKDYADAFATGVDLLLTPTTPTPAFKAGEHSGNPVTMYLADLFLAGPSLAGLPAMSLPVGRSGGLPIGAQLIGPDWSEVLMLEVASLLERALDPTAEVR